MKKLILILAILLGLCESVSAGWSNGIYYNGPKTK